MRFILVLIFVMFSPLAFGDDNAAGGGGNGNSGQQQQQQTDKGNTVTLSKEEYDRLMAGQKKDDKKDPPNPKDDKKDPLLDKVDQDNRNKEKAKDQERQMEGALNFILSSDKFIKENETVLPKNVSEIFAAAAKEKYDSKLDQANATKAALVKSFFDVQANLDELTPNQKEQVQDYLKLSPQARQEQAAAIYNNIFEPTLAAMKRIKKAEQLAKAGSGAIDGTDSDKAFRDRMIKGANAHYLGVKA